MNECSYKRLVENYWAPITVSYGVENRTTSIRLITPPTCSPAATRLEVRVPGADANPYLAIACILACGFDGKVVDEKLDSWKNAFLTILTGIERKLHLKMQPAEVVAKQPGGRSGEVRLARNLKEATETMAAPGSVARRVLGDGFVDHYVGTRRHEWRQWEQTITNWEVNRYFEVV